MHHDTNLARTPANAALKAQVLRAGLWTTFLPAFTFWPLLSTLPLFALITGGNSATQLYLNIALLATGFWAFLGGCIGFKLLLGNGPTKDRPRLPRDVTLYAAGYATIWTAAYAAYALVFGP